ncbi:unnamed protein product, partial [Lymnaea stagnalis]
LSVDVKDEIYDVVEAAQESQSTVEKTSTAEFTLYESLQEQNESFSEKAEKNTPPIPEPKSTESILTTALSLTVTTRPSHDARTDELGLAVPELQGNDDSTSKGNKSFLDGVLVSHGYTDDSNRELPGRTSTQTSDELNRVTLDGKTSHGQDTSSENKMTGEGQISESSHQTELTANDILSTYVHN